LITLLKRVKTSSSSGKRRGAFMTALVKVWEQ